MEAVRTHPWLTSALAPPSRSQGEVPGSLHLTPLLTQGLEDAGPPPHTHTPPLQTTIIFPTGFYTCLSFLLVI